MQSGFTRSNVNWLVVEIVIAAGIVIPATLAGDRLVASMLFGIRYHYPQPCFFYLSSPQQQALPRQSCKIDPWKLYAAVITTTVESRAERRTNISVALIACDLLHRAPAPNRQSLHWQAFTEQCRQEGGRISQPRISYSSEEPAESRPPVNVFCEVRIDKPENATAGQYQAGAMPPSRIGLRGQSRNGIKVARVFAGYWQ